jgi:hypothetical protein
MVTLLAETRTMEQTPDQLYNFMQTCNYYIELKILHTRNPEKFHSAYCTFIDYELDKMAPETRSGVYEIFDKFIKTIKVVPEIDEMSEKLSEKITSLFLENAKF